MRITANMLSEATVQAGIQMGGNSLVNYLNGEESDSLAKSLGGSSSSTLKALSKGKYEQMDEAAQRLQEQSAKLNESGSDSIYERARKSEDLTEVYGEVEKMVSAYNSMLDRLRTDMTTLGSFYRESLKEAVNENKELLSTVGISIDKNGRMNLDKEKLKTADVDRLEGIFGADGTLTPKVNMIAEKVADNAQANLKSISNQYNSAGNSVDTLIRSYDAKR